MARKQFCKRPTTLSSVVGCLTAQEKISPAPQLPSKELAFKSPAWAVNRRFAIPSGRKKKKKNSQACLIACHFVGISQGF